MFTIQECKEKVLDLLENISKKWIGTQSVERYLNIGSFLASVRKKGY